MIDRLDTFLVRVSSGLALFGGIGLIFATIATCISIVLKFLRRILDATLGTIFDPSVWSWVRPILGEEELVTYGVGLALFCALPWVMIQKGHVKIDLFKPVLGIRINRLLDLAGDIALAAIAYLILTRQWFLIFKKPRKGEANITESLIAGDFSVLSERLRDTHESQILGLPLWPTYAIAELCIFFFFIIACHCAVRSARRLIMPDRR